MDNELLNRFFKGECSWEEAQRISIWINSNRGRGELFEGFEAFDPKDYASSDNLNSRALLQSIKNHIVTEDLIQSVIDEDARPTVRLISNQRNTGFRAWRKYAAAIALAVMSSVLGYFILQSQMKHSAHTIADAGWITKSTEAGQKLTLHFSDGSMVILNSNSSVTYPAQFSDTMRLVQMSGEVFFEVAKDPSRPFIAETPLLKTMALGTSFNINAYSGQSEEVTLLTGKVKVSSTRESANNAILLPGQRITTDNVILNKSEVDLKTQALWKDGILYFKNTPMDEGLKSLERWYGVEIEVLNQPNLSLKLTGTFNNDYLSNVLKSLSYTVGFDYKINEKKVTIEFEDN
ncbi:FecR family protein [Marinoscillum sp. MHG1-6]|uniref:FecR family protein n=1 Tax=Marinoscillum sp. MHG1-6 TaxID=2959627 RepID=UPI002157CDF9|nr:FecR domain-containing protein [Marinoscillum sp. MHG1-6]